MRARAIGRLLCRMHETSSVSSGGSEIWDWVFVLGKCLYARSFLLCAAHCAW
jgi:hypothetical protein